MKKKRTSSMPQSGSNTKRKLIEAAHTLIWANSYAQVSVDDICRKAGVQKGSFYHFFPTKADLAAAALEDKWEHGCELFDELFTTITDPREQLKITCRLILDKQKEALAVTGQVCGCPYATLASEIGTDHQYLRDLSEQMAEGFREHYQRILKNAAKAGLIPTTGIARTTREMHIYTLGAMLEARLSNDLKAVDADLYVALLRLSRMDQKPQKTPRKR